jgi:N-acyl-D-aspartate/D-glutamate deacylase
MFSVRVAPEIWRHYFDLASETADAGGDISIQVHSRALNVLFSFAAHTPYDKWDVWSELRALPLAEQKAKLRDAQYRARLVEVANREYTGPRVVGAEARPPNWDWVFPMADMSHDQPSMAQLAEQRGVDPVELMIDLSLEHDFDIFFRQPIANENQDYVLEMMQHPHSLVTFSDSGAHVSQIMDSSLQTHLLSYWVRDRQAFTLEQAVREITSKTADMWGLHDRGRIAEGKAADLVIFDPDTVAPRMPTVEHDLPAGARRLKQTADGILHTVVNGEVVLTNNEYSGATPGKLLRA